MSYLKSKPGSVEEAITAAVMQEKLSPKQQKLDKNTQINSSFCSFYA